MKRFILALCGVASLATLGYAEPSPERRRAVYCSLDPKSVSQMTAFYSLYPKTEEGKQALTRAWELLSSDGNGALQALDLRPSVLQSAIQLINHMPGEGAAISEVALEGLSPLLDQLPNRKLKGYSAESLDDVLALEPDQVDLARALLIATEEASPGYEAMLDLLALQIRARVGDAGPAERIQEINRLIFEELQFRFPPQSLYAADIDEYTFLPHVLESRRGVCLGVSLLYLSLAQRLDLPLEAVTPPGHIYVRYRDEKQCINIETTARGVDLPSEVYLGVDTRSLQQRNLKESVGLMFVNQASVFWQNDRYQDAVEAYEKARLFLPDDPLTKELLAYNYLFVGQEERGLDMLREVAGTIPEDAVCSHGLAEDLLAGRLDIDGVKLIFKSVDESAQSIIDKQDELQRYLERFPLFRQGWFQLGVSWLQLGRTGEASVALGRFHQLYQGDASAEYTLSMLCAHRYDYRRAWEHLRRAEQITAARGHYPRALKHARLELSQLCPEPPLVGGDEPADVASVDSE